MILGYRNLRSYGGGGVGGHDKQMMGGWALIKLILEEYNKHRSYLQCLQIQIFARPAKLSSSSSSLSVDVSCARPNTIIISSTFLHPHILKLNKIIKTYMYCPLRHMHLHKTQSTQDHPGMDLTHPSQNYQNQ
jgi:hypothetical protein